MWQSYLKAALGNLAKHRSHVLINLCGLVLGMTSCILILLYVLDELRFDRWIPDAERVYRYETAYLDPQGASRLVRKAPLRAKRDLLEYFPEIEHGTRIIDHDAIVNAGDTEYFDRVWFVDAEFSSVFGLSMLHGDAGLALSDKSSVLLSAGAAQKYFGSVDVLGRTVALDGQRQFRVAGVFDDIPQASHVDFDLVARYDEADPVYGFGYSESWSAVEGYTYLKLAEGAEGAELAARLPAFLQSHAGEFSLAPGRTVAGSFAPRLLNVLDIHLDAGGVGNIETPGSRQTLVTLGIVAALVLLIAGVNYANLSSLRSFDRAKEVFVHKATGARRGQIVLHLLVEPVLISLVALIMSLSLVELLLPLYSGLLGRELTTGYLANITLFVTLVPLALLVGVVSGALPAFTLSALSARALKDGKAGGKGWRHWLQGTLVTLQFTVAATLVLGSLVIAAQQAFLEDRDLGFAPDGKFVLRKLGDAALDGQRQVLAREIGALAAVTGVTFSTVTPGDTTGAAFSRAIAVPGYRDEPLPLYPKAVAANFFEVYGIPLLAGRHFAEERGNEAFYWDAVGGEAATRAAAILNRTAATALGFTPDTALGKMLVLGSVQLDVVGVVEDFHFQSLREQLTPNLYIYSPAEYPNLTLASAANAERERLAAAVAAIWERVMPDQPLVLESVADNVAAQYAADRRQFVLVAVFSCLAIVIACLGLYSLAAYMTRRRTREVGIRKVHGAQNGDITRLFLFQFTRPVLLANVLSLPCGIYLAQVYLAAYEYHIEAGASLFMLAAVLTLGMAWCAVILQTLRAATAQPVRALRYE